MLHAPSGPGGPSKGLLRLIFWILRNTFPILKVPFQILGKKWVLVTRFDDVQEVLARTEFFHQPYEPKLKVVLAGGNFMLGQNDVATHNINRSLMRTVVPPADVQARLVPETERLATEIIAAGKGRVDVAYDLSQVVTTRLFGDYFGTPGPDVRTISDWIATLFTYSFADVSNDPALLEKTLQIAPALRAYLDSVIAARKLDRGRHDDVLERCLTLKDIETPGVDDIWIRDNLFGLVVGALPQAPIMIPQLINVLLDDPVQLKGACAAASDGDMQRVTAYVLEASRFDPVAPGILRECAADYQIAAGTFRSTTIRAGSTVVPVLESAMFDGRIVKDPGSFKLNRPEYTSLLFSAGIHMCFGVYINRAMVPALCAPLLRQRNLRRAEGADGQMTKNGIFPARLVVEFDP